jgi:hypothetical protein
MTRDPDFRAKVQALSDSNRTADWDYHRAIEDVLALIDKEQPTVTAAEIRDEPGFVG